MLSHIPIKDKVVNGLFELSVGQSEEKLGLFHIINISNYWKLDSKFRELHKLLVHYLLNEFSLLNIVVYSKDESLHVIPCQLHLKSSSELLLFIKFLRQDLYGSEQTILSLSKVAVPYEVFS
jgi:hypothetical protein